MNNESKREFFNFKLIIFLLLALIFFRETFASTITGAGATFPYPLYAQWANEYHKLTGVKLNYQSIGSGGGIKQILAGTVAFGASDKPLSPSELRKWGLIQFPTVIGGVVPIINIQGIKKNQLKLNGALLASIYLGNIRYWNNSLIQSVNAHLKLPHEKIVVVHRSDSSGTSFLFTSYLSAVSSVWKTEVGADKAVAWPVGIGGKGNEGVAATVKHINGAIGYVEYAYVKKINLTGVKLENQAGNYIKASLNSFISAARHADWNPSEGFYAVLVNQPGKEAWPIIGATFILMRQRVADPAEAKEVLNYFNWAYNNGNEITLKLDYVPLPKNIVKEIQQTWKTVKNEQETPVWLPLSSQ